MAAVSLFAATLFASLNLNASDSDFYGERFRPQFHFTPATNWMNDPNGMMFYDGEYHLFYQYNPFGNVWGHMSWGHAVSSNLMHWQHLPVALAEEDGVMIFSGSAVVDWQNSSGLGTNGTSPLIAIYTGHYTGKPLQNQNLAYSNDKGRTWTKYAGNPVLDIGAKDFRDPKVMWHEPTKRWIMTVALPTEHKIRFYASTNLKEWIPLSDFGPAGATGGIWECPDLFSLAVEGTKEQRWVLIVNLNPGGPAGGSGSQYFIGQFDGQRFVLDPSYPSSADSQNCLWLDHGADCYATVTWSDVPKADGRRIALGWMSNWDYAQDVPTSPWRSAMTVPREVRLRKTAHGIGLVQSPVRELALLRDRHSQFKGGSISTANAWLARKKIAGDQLELSVELAAASSGVQGVKVLKGQSEETVIGVDRDRGRVFVDRARSGVNFHPKFSGMHDAMLMNRGGKVKLHVLVDTCSVEVFVNDGEIVFSDLVFPSPGSREMEFFAAADGAAISRAEVWTLKSSWK